VWCPPATRMWNDQDYRRMAVPNLMMICDDMFTRASEEICHGVDVYGLDRDIPACNSVPLRARVEIMHAYLECSCTPVIAERRRQGLLSLDRPAT
jgi:hypothetical protein